jgi:lysyl-tRNA synthetase class 2
VLHERSVLREKAPPWVARLVAALGLVSIISAALPGLRPRLDLLHEVLPPFAPPIAGAATAVAGMLLLVIASGLRRRKRRAWWVAVALSAAAVALHLLKGLDVEEAALAAVVLGVLLVARPGFTGKPDPRSTGRVLWVAVGAVAAAVGTGLLVVALDRRSLRGTPSLLETLEETVLGLVGLNGPVEYGSERHAMRVEWTLLGLGAAVVVVVLLVALRPAGPPAHLTEQDVVRLRDLLARHGSADSLGYFALRRDKSAVFSASGKAAVAYRVVGGVALAAGDPVGDVEAWPGAIAAWWQLCTRYAWVPGVLAASELGADVYRREVEFDALELGDEAIVEVADFTLEGRPMRGVRQAVARVRRAGYCARVEKVGELAPGRAAELRRLAELWRGGDVERGFSMALGRFAAPEDPDELVVTAADGTGRACGLLGFVPWGCDAYSLDVMRRAPDADNGVVELMVTTLLEACPALGVQRISLNFAVFRWVFERGGRIGAGPVLRLWHRVLTAAGRFWQIESLFRANAKYRPVWEPRFVCFRDAGDLPRVLLAALRAEAFLQRPRLPQLLRRSRLHR